MGWVLNPKRVTLVVAASLFLVIGFAPLCAMIVQSLFPAGSPSVRNYVEVFGNRQTWVLFRNSIVLAALTSGVAAIIGVTLGTLIVKTDLRLRTLFAIAFSLPLLFPPYVLAVGWFEILGRGGMLARSFGPGVAAITSRWLFGLPGAVLVLSSALLPIILLITITSLKSVNPALEEAARLSCGPSVVLRRISLPLIRPGVVLAVTLVFLLAMGEFGAPAFLRLNVFPVVSFTQSSAFYNVGAATAAAVPLVAVVFAGIAVEQRVLGQRSYSFRWAGENRATLIPLAKKGPAILLATIALAVLLVGIPMTGVLWRGFSVVSLSEAIRRAGDSAVRSILYAGIVASVLCVLGFFLGYLVHRRALPGWRWLDALNLFLFILPGTILGIGLISLWNRRSTNWIYATPAMLLIGFIAQYTCLSTRILAAGLSQLPRSLEEAAEIAGMSWLRRTSRILAPLLKQPLIAVWIVTYVFCLRDVSLPLLLAPPGRDTLTGRTMTLMANGSPELIASLCLLSVFLAIVPLGVLASVRRTWSNPQ